MVQRKAEGHLDFDLDLAKETDWKKNPAILRAVRPRAYAWDRTQSERDGVFRCRDASECGRGCLSYLPEEIDLLKRRSLSSPKSWSRVQGRLARAAPRRLLSARDLAGLWSPYVQDGNRDTAYSRMMPHSYPAHAWGSALAVRIGTREWRWTYSACLRTGADVMAEHRIATQSVSRRERWPSDGIVVARSVGRVGLHRRCGISRVGMVAGIVWEEPGLVLAYLTGDTEADQLGTGSGPRRPTLTDRELAAAPSSGRCASAWVRATRRPVPAPPREKT